MEPTDPVADDALAVALGRTIQVLRTSNGMSRRDLASRAAISYSYLSAIENGDRFPSSKILAMVAAALRVHTHELLAAAEARVAENAVEDDEVTGARELDAMFERAEERRMSRQLGRLGYAIPPPAPRSELGAVEELRALLAQMDPADRDFLIEMARKLAGRNQ